MKRFSLITKQDPGIHQTTLRGTRFTKIAGPSGDWIVIDDPNSQVVWSPEQISWLCDRSVGVGASGVVVMSEADSTQPDHRRLEAWGPNGDPLPTMTEPARAATHVLALLGRLAPEATSHHVFATDRGLITTVYTPTYIGVDVGQWAYDEPETAKAAGSDVLVMAAGLTDPRPGLTLVVEEPHVVLAVESAEELAAIRLQQRPSIEPASKGPVSIGFVVPHDRLVDQGMGQLMLRHYHDRDNQHALASACAAAVVALRIWSGLLEPRLWQVDTPDGEIVVQIHDQHRISTFMKLHQVFSGEF